MRLLLFGADGFMGRLLRQTLPGYYPHATVLASGREGPLAVDITDVAAVDRLIADHQPTHVINLAALSSVPACERAPGRAFAVNASGPLNIGLALLRHTPSAKFLHISSSEVYGAAFDSGIPVSELTPCDPKSVYGASKYAGELAVRALASKGLRVLILRPFTHTGPGQSSTFALPAFAERIAKAERSKDTRVIKTGRLDVVRDVCDGRDVARAYICALVEMDHLPNAAAINICSGIGYTLEQLLNMFLQYAAVPLSWEIDPSLVRPADLPWTVGDRSRARHILGWEPVVPIETTLRSLLDEARKRVAQNDARTS